MRAYASARHPGFARLAASGIGAIHVLGKPHRESQGDDDGYVERRRSEPSELDNGFESLGAAAAPVRKSMMMMMMMIQTCRDAAKIDRNRRAKLTRPRRVAGACQSR